jgi:hypothetical protein
MTETAAAGAAKSEAGDTTTVAGGTTTTPAAGATADTNADGTKKADDKSGTAAATTKVETKVETPVKKAPEKYALKLPEGGRLSERAIGYVERIAREVDLSNEDAQKVLAYMGEQNGALSAEYLAATKADKDVGGDKLEASQTVARQAIARVRPDGHPRREAFIKMLNETSLGNQVEFVAFCADLGKLMAEDSPARGNGGSPSVGMDAVLDKMYPAKTK